MDQDGDGTGVRPGAGAEAGQEPYGLDDLGSASAALDADDADDESHDDWAGQPEPLDQPPPLGYFPNPLEPRVPNPRSDETWAAIRADYLAGEPAQVVADRYGVGLSTLRLRAAREHWRRMDQPDPDPFVLDEDAPAPDLDRLSRQALARMDHAIKRGRAAEAASWMRTWRCLTSPLALTTALTPPAPKPVDRIATIEALSREAEAISKDVIKNFNHITPEYRARIDARLEQLMRQLSSLDLL